MFDNFINDEMEHIRARQKLQSLSLDEYPAGVFLWIIINQKKFDPGSTVSYSEREGADVDEANIKDALEHFKVDLRVWTDLTLSELLQSLKRIYDEVEAEPNKFAGLVILGMSHGEQIDGRDFLVTKDNKLLSCEKVSDLYHNCFCFGLKNRPKFYLFNCCRGGTPNVEIGTLSVNSPIVFDDDIISIDAAKQVERNKEDVDSVIGYKKGDYVIVHSTIKGCVSMRHKTNGSIFVFELSQKIVELESRQHSNFEDIVRQACISTSRHELSGLGASQLPEMTTTLRAPCKLVVKGK